MYVKKILVSSVIFISGLFANTPSHSYLSDETFSYHLYQVVNPTKKNAVISPFSIYTGLLTAYLGATEDTEEAIQTVLGLQGSKNQIIYEGKNLIKQTSSKEHPILLMANGMFINKNFMIMPRYKAILRDDFLGIVKKVNFKKTSKALQTINDWVKQKTEGEITNLLSATDLSSMTEMMLINTLFFEGKWSSSFEAQKTYTAPFYPNFKEDDHCIDVHMMKNIRGYPYFENESYQIIGLPIQSAQDSSFVFYLFSPKVTPEGSLFSFLQQKQAFANVQKVQDENLVLSVPKFTIRMKNYLEEPLSQMGMRIAFQNDANFSGITGQDNLKMTDVIHEALLSIDEEGLFATASTAATFSSKAILPPKNPKTVTLDQPFFFTLYDHKTNNILFMGECYYPKTTDGKHF